MDREVALEALGLLCNTKITSFQSQRSGVGLNAGAFFGAAAPQQLFINQLIYKVLDGDETCPMLGYPIQWIQDPQDLVKSIRALSLDANVDGTGRLQLIVDEDEFFDPKFDYDFTYVTDYQTYYRGGEVYQRPCGWKRFGLKVLGKYDEDAWLGNNHRTTESVKGEWPVSYHGTSKKGAEGIIGGHYEPGPRELFGRGIYSTPYISEAIQYTKTFQSEKTGKWYQVLLQNRINPKYREKYNQDKYWLVSIPKGKSKKEEKEMVDRAIRPYCLLLKEEGRTEEGSTGCRIL